MAVTRLAGGHLMRPRCRPCRPRDAAALVLLRGSEDAPEVLLGRRRAGARFMPGVFVTPGGALEDRDSRPSGFPEALPAQPPGLDRATAGRLLAFARCALRETYEEVGVLVGPGTAPAPRVEGEPVWRGYTAGRRRPGFERLYLVARAITPTCSPIRFHTRFFLSEGGDVDTAHAGDGELEAPAWIPWRDLDGLPMAEVTPIVLRHALALRSALAHGATRPVARLLWRGRRRLCVRPLPGA